MWSNEVRQNRETNEEHDEHCVEETFQVARVKFDKDGKGSRETLCTGISLIHKNQFVF